MIIIIKKFHEIKNISNIYKKENSTVVLYNNHINTSEGEKKDQKQKKSDKKKFQFNA